MRFKTCGERLRYILHDRKATPWAKKLGISPGTLARMKFDSLPTNETLTTIMRTENVNLNWFISGKGQPFMVDTYLDAEAFLTQARYHLEDNPNYEVVFAGVERSNIMLCIFSEPASFMKNNTVIKYRHIEVMTCIYDPIFTDNVDVKSILISPNDCRRIANGEMGTYLLFGDGNTKGLIV